MAIFDKLSKWVRRQTSDFPQPLSNHNFGAYFVRNNVFFRLDHTFNKSWDFKSLDPQFVFGFALLHNIAFQLEAPWQVHVINTSVWQQELVATIGVESEVLFHLMLFEWDDGWLLTVDPMQNATDPQIRAFISTIDQLISALATVRDVRWFHNEVLTCGCFHNGDFEMGRPSPFDISRDL